jgi:hypothetical protein
VPVATPQVGLGLPGGFPLPNAGAPGNAYGMQQKLHPAAQTGLGMSDSAMPPAMGAKK